MGNMKKLAFGAIATLLALLSGCDKPKQDLKNCEDYICVDSVSDTYVYGFVRDADGNALEHVLVTSGEDSTLTNRSGAYSLEKCHAVNGRSVVKFENDDYFSVVRTANIIDGEARVDAVMMAQDSREGVSEVTRFYNSQGATIEVGNMKITIPANSMVYEKDRKDFSGSVFASVYYLNPKSETFTKEMPGGDMSGVTAEGKDVILLSYGMVEVTLKDSVGQKLQLKEGAESSMTFPLPDGFSEDQKYDQIPLWYFDEAKGTWMEEGVATKNGGSYVGNVKHFSWYNLDYPSTRATIRGRVLNKDGKPLPHVLVTISQTSAYSDSAGYYWAYVPQNTPVFVTVKPEDYANYTNCPIYNVNGLEAGDVYTQDVILPNMPCLHGTVTDKEGQPFAGVVVRTDKITTITDRKGEYIFYYNVDEPFSMFVDEGYTMINKKQEIQKYVFKNPWEVDNEKSYDFVIDRPIFIHGSIYTSDFRRLGDSITVTALVDQKKYSIRARRYYYFPVSSTTKEVTLYVQANDGFGLESNRVTKELEKKRWQYMPNIIIPTGISVVGTIVNTCGPSKAKITVEAGHGKNKRVFSRSSRFGYFDVDLPISLKDAKAKVKINCNGKRITKRIDLNSDRISLGTIEVCAGEKPDPNCIYAIIGDRTVKFNTKKDKYTEMFQKKPQNETSRYQVWYKSPDYDGMLILENEYSSSYGKNHRLTVYLLTDQLNVAQKSELVPTEESNVYKFKTDYEMYGNAGDDEDIYLYGSADVENKNVDDEISSVFQSTYKKAKNILVGRSESTAFYTLNLNPELTKEFEKMLKDNGFKEKTTFMDDEQRITSIFMAENSEAVIHRNTDKTTDATILVRDGIGSEPLFCCWKVDFRNSALKKKGESNINYMWKNEADIAQLVMFGPIMGVRFTKTNMEEDKCGCSKGFVPVVASK